MISPPQTGLPAQPTAGPTLAAHILATQDQEPNPGLEWVLALLQLSDLGEEARGALCNAYLFDLQEGLENQGRLATKLALLEGVRLALQGLCQGQPDHLAWPRDLAASHSRIGDLRVAQGNLGGGERAYQAALAIRERLTAADPDNADWQRDLAVSCWKMADLTERTDPGQALGWWRKPHDALAGMKARGLHLSPVDEGSLEQLKQKGRA